MSEDVVLDVEIEVHADLLGEVVVERNEPHFDGDLQVLQPPELLQQVDDFLVDFLGLADDDAQIGLEGPDRARTAHVLPRSGPDRRGDQVDQAVEVRLRPAAQAAGTRAARAARLGAGRRARVGRGSHLGHTGRGLVAPATGLPSRPTTIVSGAAAEEPNWPVPPMPTSAIALS